MQKKTKDLFLRLKALHPAIHGISYDYDTDWKAGMIVERWYLLIPNTYLRFNTEKELQDEITRLINVVGSDLGFRFPETVKKFNL